MNGLLHLSPCGMAHAIREKTISSFDLVQTHLERIQAVNPKLNAIVQLPAERALEQARAADAMLPRSEINGPLCGVPVNFKDAIETTGIVSTGGASCVRTTGRCRGGQTAAYGRSHSAE